MICKIPGYDLDTNIVRRLCCTSVLTLSLMPPLEKALPTCVQWRHHLAKYIKLTAREQRTYRYSLAIELDVAENTIRHRLKRANYDKPLPPPLYPSRRRTGQTHRQRKAVPSVEVVGMKRRVCTVLAREWSQQWCSRLMTDSRCKASSITKICVFA